MEEEEDSTPPPVFHPLPVTNAVQLNIYAISGDRLHEAYQELVLRHLTLPDGFWEDASTQGWRRQSILNLDLRSSFLRMTKNDLTVGNVPLAPDGAAMSLAACRLFFQSPLLEVVGMHGFLPDEEASGRKQKSRKTSPQPDEQRKADEMNIDDWLEEELGSSGDEAAAAPSPKKRGRVAKKINQNGRITVRSSTDGRFPGLNDALVQFNSFVLAMDTLAKRLLKQDRKVLPDLELLATYHTHISKSDAYTSSNRYKQSLEELEAECESQPLTDCNINIKIKGGYIARTSSSPEGGIYRAPRLDYIEHLPDAFDVSKFEPSSLEELVQCGRNCYVQFLFHLGQLYERQATGRDGSGVYRGMTLRVYRIVFWPVADYRLERSTGPSNVWGASMHNSVSATTAFYAGGAGGEYVKMDEFGRPIKK
jgi:hypothetical protein